MTKSLEISVVIPAYQAADYIADTLASVASQTLLPHELIVVDDGSMDATFEVVEGFAIKHPHLVIHLVREPHCGPGAARNIGVKKASSFWIAFLDADDIWHPEKLKKMTAAIQAHPQANFFCHNETIRFLNGTKRVLNYHSGFCYDRPIPRQLYKHNYFSTSAVVCMRDMILRWGGFDETLSSAQDYELWLRMSPDLVPVFVPEVLGTYVLRKGNITTSQYWRRLLNILRVKHHHRKKVGTFLFAYSTLHTSIAHLVVPLYTGVKQALTHGYSVCISKLKSPDIKP